MTASTFPKSNNNNFETLEERNKKIQRETAEYIIKINAVLCEKEK